MMFSARLLDGGIFGVAAPVVAGALGGRVLWAVTSSGDRVPLRRPVPTLAAAVAADYAASSAPALPGCGPVDIPRWAAAVAADRACGVKHECAGPGWESAARAALTLDYSRIEPGHDTEAVRRFISAPTVSALLRHHGVSLPVDMRFCDLCV